MTAVKTELTKVQATAAHHFTGPAIVMAGPGSGKTRVLIERIRFLIKEKGTQPGSILAVTFTEKAAAQMQTRLFAALGAQAEEVHVSTIHSLCHTVMEEYFMFHDFGASFDVMDGDTQRLFVNAHRRALGIDGEHGWLPLISKAAGYNRDFEAQVCAFYNAAAEHRINLEMLEARIPAGPCRSDCMALINSCRIYDELLRGSKLIDFARLQSTALSVLNKHAEALAALRGRYAFVLVDEYQDTSPAQEELIKLIAGGGHNIFVVGDQHQSIYGFRGADAENFTLFPERR